MPERSGFSPFSTKKALRTYGSISTDGSGFVYDGFPYIGEPYDFKDDDPPEYLPQKKANACVNTFDLSDEDDYEQYRAVLQKIADNLAIISEEEKVYDAESKNWRIFLRWVEPYYAPPVAALQQEDTPGEGKTHVLPETDIPDIKDVAKVRLEGNGDTNEQDDTGNNTRYSTIDQVLGSFSDEETDLFTLISQRAAANDAEDAAAEGGEPGGLPAPTIQHVIQPVRPAIDTPPS